MDPTTTLTMDTTTATTTTNPNSMSRRKKYALAGAVFVVLLIAALVLDLVLAPVKDAGVNDIVVDVRDTVPRADIEFTLDYGSKFSFVEPRGMKCTLDSGRVNFAVSPIEEGEEAGAGGPPRYHVEANCPEEDVESHAALIWDLMTNTTSKKDTLTSLMDNGTCEMTVRVRLGHILPYTHTVEMPLRKLIEMGEERKKNKKRKKNRKQKDQEGGGEEISRSPPVMAEDEQDDDGDEETSPLAVHVCHMEIGRLDLCLPLDLPSSTRASLPSTVRIRLPALRLDAQPTYTEGMTISMDAFEASFDPAKAAGLEEDGSSNAAVFSLSSANQRQSGAPLPFYRPLIDLFLADVDTTKVVITLDGEGSFLEILLGRDHEFFIRHYEEDAEEFYSTQAHQILNRRRLRANEEVPAAASSDATTARGAAVSDTVSTTNTSALLSKQDQRRRRADPAFDAAYEDAAANCLRINDNSDAFDFGLCWLLEIPEKRLMIVGNAVLFDTGVTGLAETSWVTGDEYAKVDMAALLDVEGETGLMDMIGGLEFDWLVNSDLQFDMSLANVGTLWPFVGRVKTRGSISDERLDMTLDEVTLTQGVKGMDGGTGTLVVEYPLDADTVLSFDVDVAKGDAYLMDVHVSLETNGAEEDVLVSADSGFLWDSEYVWDLESSFALDWGEETEYVYMTAELHEAVSEFNVTLSGSLEVDEEDDIAISGALTHREDDVITMEIGLLFDNSSFAIETNSNCTWNGDDIWMAGFNIILGANEETGTGSFMGIEITEEVSAFDFSIANYAERLYNDDLTLNTTILHADGDEITMSVAILFNEEEVLVFQSKSHCFWNEADVWDSELEFVFDSETSDDSLDTVSFLGVDIAESVNDFEMSMSTYAMRDGEVGLNDDLFLNSTIVFNAEDVVTLNVSILFNEPELFVLLGETTGFWDQEDLWIAGAGFTFDWDNTTATGEITGNAEETVSQFIMSALIGFEEDLDIFKIIFQQMFIEVGGDVHLDTTGQFTFDVENSEALLDLEDVGRADFVVDVDFIWYEAYNFAGMRLEKVLITRSTGETALEGTATYEVDEGDRRSDKDNGGTLFVMDFMMPIAGRQLEVDIQSFYDEVSDSYTSQATHIRNSRDGKPDVDFASRTRVGYTDSSFEFSASDSADYDFATNFTASVDADEDAPTAELNLERVLLRVESDTFVDMTMTMLMEEAANDDFMMAMTSSSTEASDLQMDMDMSINWFAADEALMMSADHMVLAWRDTSFLEMPMELSDPLVTVPNPAPTPEETVEDKSSSSVPSPAPNTSPVTASPMEPVETSYVFPDIEMTLRGMPELTPESKAAFEAATAAYYDDIYQPKISRRLEDELVVSSFETVVTVTGESPDENGNTITYDQTITFASADAADEEAARDLIVAPLSTEQDKAQYLTFLIAEDEDFSNVTAVESLEVPAITTVPSGDGGGDDEEKSDGSGAGHAWAFCVMIWSMLSAMLLV